MGILHERVVRDFALNFTGLYYCPPLFYDIEFSWSRSSDCVSDLLPRGSSKALQDLTE